MKPVIFLFLIGLTSSFAQTIDYNLKNGFAANGYDVVAYFKHQALEGSEIFTSNYNGVNYKFISKENLETFNNSPESYVPQFGGYCAYAIALKSDKVPINPKTFQITDGKLYLFYNAWGTNTRKLWNKENEKDLIEKADDNWDKIKYKK